MKAPVMTVLLAILTADARWDGWECRGRTILPEPSLALRGGTGVDREAFGFYKLLGVERDATESVLPARMNGWTCALVYRPPLSYSSCARRVLWCCAGNPQGVPEARNCIAS